MLGRIPEERPWLNDVSLGCSAGWICIFMRKNTHIHTILNLRILVLVNAVVLLTLKAHVSQIRKKMAKDGDQC